VAGFTGTLLAEASFLNRTYVFLAIGVVLILTIGISTIWMLTSKNSSTSLFLGYYDKKGKVAILAPPFTTRTRPFKEGLAGVRLGNDSIGYINTRGQVVFKFNTDVPDPPNGPGVQDFSEGMVPVRQDGLWGYADNKGTMIIKPQYDDVMHFREGLAPVKLRGFWGYIDKSNKTVIERDFQNAMPFSEGLAAVMNRDKKIGYIDKTVNSDHSVNWVVPAQFSIAGRFCEKRAWVDDGQYIDPTGKVVIDLANEPEVEHGQLMDEEQRRPQGHENMLVFYLNPCCLFDVRERVLVDSRKSGWHRWTETTEFHEGYALAKAGAVKRFIDKNGRYFLRVLGTTGRGEPIVSANFMAASSFCEGVAAVCVEEKFRYMKPNGDFLTPNDYIAAADFSEGMARVALVGQYEYIDKKGNVVFQVKKDQGMQFSEGFAQIADHYPDR
jgi:WG containing repeat